MAKTAPPQENLANSRYTDLIGEPVARLLSPIKGYESAPLLSLEESTKPLAHLFDCIEENVWIAKENSKTPPDNLTDDESAAIHLYTMQFDTDPSFYQLLNSKLRGENREDLKPWFSYLKLFLTALYKLPSYSQTLWRGVRGVDLSKEYPTGRKFAWWGVSSCTTSLEVLQAETFLGRKGMRTLFSIESQNGKCIVPHSYFKDTEKEIVLMPGTYFEVVGQVSPADDLYIIQLKELNPPFPFVKPPFKRDPSVQQDTKPVENHSVPPPPAEPSVSLKSTTTETDNSTKPAAAAAATPAAQPAKARIVVSTIPAHLQDAVIDTIREAINEGTDDEDIKSIIVDELSRKFGGIWWAYITPKNDSHGLGPYTPMCAGKPFLTVKIDKYGISVLRK